MMIKSVKVAILLEPLTRYLTRNVFFLGYLTLAVTRLVFENNSNMMIMKAMILLE